MQGDDESIGVLYYSIRFHRASSDYLERFRRKLSEATVMAERNSKGPSTSLVSDFPSVFLLRYRGKMKVVSIRSLLAFDARIFLGLVFQGRRERSLVRGPSSGRLDRTGVEGTRHRVSQPQGPPPLPGRGGRGERFGFQVFVF